jgi:hypothetical protein
MEKCKKDEEEGRLPEGEGKKCAEALERRRSNMRDWTESYRIHLMDNGVRAVPN